MNKLLIAGLLVLCVTMCYADTITYATYSDEECTDETASVSYDVDECTEVDSAYQKISIDGDEVSISLSCTTEDCDDCEDPVTVTLGECEEVTTGVYLKITGSANLAFGAFAMIAMVFALLF